MSPLPLFVLLSGGPLVPFVLGLGLAVGTDLVVFALSVDAAVDLWAGFDVGGATECAGGRLVVAAVSGSDVLGLGGTGVVVCVCVGFCASGLSVSGFEVVDGVSGPGSSGRGGGDCLWVVVEDFVVLGLTADNMVVDIGVVVALVVGSVVLDIIVVEGVILLVVETGLLGITGGPPDVEAAGMVCDTET